jgi:hypothetical protein
VQRRDELSIAAVEPLPSKSISCEDNVFPAFMGGPSPEEDRKRVVEPAINFKSTPPKITEKPLRAS